MQNISDNIHECSILILIENMKIYINKQGLRFEEYVPFYLQII